MAGAIGLIDQIDLSEDLIKQFDKLGPRYTSYPTADRFHDDFSCSAYESALRARHNNPAPPPFSLYVHVPFCQSLCYFCACNKIITHDQSRSTHYVDTLLAEMQLLEPFLGTARLTGQLHFGGGTPTFLPKDELRRLLEGIQQHFYLSPQAELSIEIDPRTVTHDTMSFLAELGFNRTSFGVQDFDPAVQQAINRVQPLVMVEKAMAASKAADFESINTDLIYGLPKQSVASFSQTVDALIALRPDRIALYNYAHLPQRFRAQRLIHAEDLPSADERLQIFLMAAQRLLKAGYQYIGLDHFALPADELYLAQLDNSLHRNFQGYTTRADSDLIALGVSAIGKIGTTHLQNERSLNAYVAAIESGQLATFRGFEMSHDDVLRADVIMRLMCSVNVEFADINNKHNIDFSQYFSTELRALQPYVEAGLLELSSHKLKVTAKGRLFVRAISMEFDRYLRQATLATYSRLI